MHEVWAQQTFGTKKTKKTPEDEINFQNPRCIESMLAGNSLTSFSDSTLEGFTKHLILDFFLASIYLQRVDYFGGLIYPKISEKDVIKLSINRNPHLQVPLGLFEPRLSAKSAEAFKEIEDAEGILRNITNLTDSIDFVVSAIDHVQSAHSGQRKQQEHDARLREVKQVCAERGHNANRALEALNRQLDYLSKRHAIREAKAIKILTILASLYLPLSLSAAILSMATPFQAVVYNRTPERNLDHTNLAFDFFGVFVALAAVTLFVVHTIRLGLSIRINGLGILSKRFASQFSILHYGSRWRFGGRGGKVFKVLRLFTWWWISAGFFITLLTIFWAGMLGYGQLAWHIAKWMFTGYFSGIGLLTVLCLSLYRWLYVRKIRG